MPTSGMPPGEAWRAKALKVDAVMDILRTTVPRLEQLTDDLEEHRLYAKPNEGWSVNDVLAHLRTCHDVLGGNMLRIVREDHPASLGPAGWRNQAVYMEWKFRPAFDAFRAQRAELLDVLAPLTPEDWEERTTTVYVPPNKTYERNAHFYGDWMARHERGHLKHIARLLEAVR